MLRMILQVIGQTILLFIMLFCIFGFAASFEYPSINRYQLLYTALLLAFSSLFLKLSTQHTVHRQLSFYMVMLTTMIWLFVVLHAWF